MIRDILKVCESTLEFPAADRLSSFPSVLEGDSQIGSPRPSSLRGIELGRVTDLIGILVICGTERIAAVDSYHLCGNFNVDGRSLMGRSNAVDANVKKTKR